jgi:hypothetical protein
MESQGFLQDDTVSSDMEVFNLKIRASMVANAFCGLHNDKYTKYSPHKNCIVPASTVIDYPSTLQTTSTNPQILRCIKPSTNSRILQFYQITVL